MNLSKHAFPWGIHIGNLIQNTNDAIPLCVNSADGGFIFITDEHNSSFAFNYIEEIILNVLGVCSVEDVVVDVFDFSIKKRFGYLSELKQTEQYNIAITQHDAKSHFEALEKIATTRHHSLLSPQIPNIYLYNQQSAFVEKYHIILLNLEHFPDEFISFGRIKSFFESCYEAGFYLIAYGCQDEISQNKHKAIEYFLNKYKKISLFDHKMTNIKDLFPEVDFLKEYAFEPLMIDKNRLLQQLKSKVIQDTDRYKEFLSIPIGTSLDGRQTLYFSMGDKSQNYHAFVTGISGSGKTTLINNLIVGIAQQYTKDEIRLFLMDYKEGTEFGLFENHPNCETIYLDNQNIQASIDLLESFVALKEERSIHFKNNKVSDITSYNAQNPSSPMSRNLLIIDEIHRLFTGNFTYAQQQHFNMLLEEIAKQGRSFGLHLILTTQSLENVNINASIMNQIQLRISYKLQSYQEAMKIFNEQNIDEVRSLGKYEFIYNAKGGAKGSNIHGRATYIPKESIVQIIQDSIFQKKSDQILTPHVIDKKPSDIPLQTTIASEKISVQKDTISHPFQENHQSRYDTSSEKELLVKLRAHEVKGIHS